MAQDEMTNLVNFSDNICETLTAQKVNLDIPQGTFKLQLRW